MAAIPAGQNARDAVAQRLAHAHYRVDRSIRDIYRLLAPDGAEDRPREPVKLLEVNEETAMVGLMPVYFTPDAAHGILFPSMILEVRPEEFAQLQAGVLTLPNNWRIGEHFARPED
ncbi:MAG: hypothetical protein AB1716_01750 [Planctomycetota bacterium]